MAIWDLITPPTDNIYERVKQTQLDLNILKGIKTTRYLCGHPEVKKSRNLHPAWDFAQNLEDHDRLKNMLRVSPFVFEFILLLIKDHPDCTNNSNNPQANPRHLLMSN